MNSSIISIVSLSISICGILLTLYLNFFYEAKFISILSHIWFCKVKTDELKAHAAYHRFINLGPAEKNMYIYHYKELADASADRDAFIKKVKNIPAMLELKVDLEFLKEQIGTALFLPRFIIPLTIYNTGGRTGVISGLNLHLRDTTNNWHFRCIGEVKNIEDFDWEKDIQNNPFTGIAVTSKSTVKLNGAFIITKKSFEKTKNNIIIRPGNYWIEVFGYDINGKTLFQTNQTHYEITEESYLRAYYGKNVYTHLVADRFKDFNL